MKATILLLLISTLCIGQSYNWDSIAIETQKKLDRNVIIIKKIDMENKLESPALQQVVVTSRLFAVMTDDYVILKLFWKKEDADKELETYKCEYKDELFFVEEVDIH